MASNRDSVEGTQRQSLGGQDRDFIFLEDENLARAAQEGRHVRGDEHLVATESDDEGRAAASERDERVRRVGGDAGDGIRAVELAGGSRDGVDQALALMALDQVRDHLGVRL